MKSLKQVPNEFDTKLELLKITYNIYHREFTIEKGIHSSGFFMFIGVDVHISNYIPRVLNQCT
jgi:hypothetical protein